MPELKSEGKCLYCKEKFLKANIYLHMQKELAEKIKSNKPGESFLLKIEPDSRWGENPYFLSLWADGAATVEDIDDFLRAIWLECCGHMSSLPNQKKEAYGIFLKRRTYL